uniref:hypothetical protein n=1 Tax=Nitrospira sp. BLG_1 TaxID=3395883 RepID=UPI0039BC2AE8
LDDQPRSRRGDKEQKLVDRLKSSNDKLLDELKKRDRLLDDMSSRLSRVEQDRTERETRADVNRRADDARAEAEREGREMWSRVSALDQQDPERGQKTYTILAEYNRRARQEDIRHILEEVDRRSSAAVTRRALEQQRFEESKKRTIAELERNGMSKDLFDVVQDIATAKAATDFDWFKRTPEAEQIPLLVSDLKERLMKSKRTGQEFQNDKRAHRADMGGVLGEGSSGTRRGWTRGDAEDGERQPSSILSDLRRMRETQMKYSGDMLRRK